MYKKSQEEKRWEFKNSLWLIATFFGKLNFISFFYIGYKTGVKRWILTGWAYLVLMWGIPYVTHEFYFGYVLTKLLEGFVGLLWISGIVYGFLSRKEFLERLRYSRMHSGKQPGGDFMRTQRNMAVENFRRAKGIAEEEPTPSQGFHQNFSKGVPLGKEGHMKEQAVKSVIPIYLIGAVWLIFAFVLPFYRWTDYLVAAAVSAVVYFLADKLIPTKKILVPEEYEAQKTGNDELDKLLESGSNFINRMRKANDAILDPEMSAQIARLEQLSTNIFDYVAANVAKIGHIRKFLNYYLPTTLKLLESYDHLNTQPVKGENITVAMKRIEEIMGTIVKAFEAQLDNLFSSDAMDISADITVLEGMLAAEGLTQDTMRGK